MTPLDILLAPSDQSLNQFVSLKKLAPFRDPAKKRRDRRQLAKRARLRQWRKDVFGRRGPPTVLDAAGPSPPPPSTPSLTLHLQPPLDLDPTLVGDSAEAKGEGEGKGKRKRKRKRSAL
ncbi:hypothetical protein XA68_18379 [Ophiocordyceps unilateralis]|uniref:Kri1-like C-terminal domain-containing protein n=1 Tax=Ophiocordyceps unilateralis TaxID=268505 RepID=A0A2A9PIH6_OPHUN|nr:hypothetical protein XA68_18379 [Ophiocordyceps unilateralis]